ncbi:MAG TPA: hypothetical protein VJI70_00495 [Candidatus Paceibacterota bacterium]
MRRYIIIAAVVIVVLGVGAAMYFLFFGNTASITVAPAGSASLPSAGRIGGASTTEDDAARLTGSATNTVGAPTPITARLVRISAGPVVPGEAVVNIKAANASSSPPSTSLGTGDVAVSYIERRSGNVYSYLSRAGTLTRTSNRTVPGIQSAVWPPDASLAFVRYLSGIDSSTINTYGLAANGSGGFFLPQNLSDIAISSTSILTLSSGVNGSVASLSRTDGTRSSQIFTTPLSALRISFAGKSQYLAFTKPAAALPGSAFLVDSAGRFSRIAGPLNGLVALASPSGKWALVSYTSDGAMQMELVNTTTSESVPLPVATIADKCVWTADDSVVYCGVPVDPPVGFSYPDDWYQGAVHFSDRIWKINVSGRYAQLVLDFSKENKDSLDAEALVVDSLNTILVFVNKNDGSLWSYSL